MLLEDPGSVDDSAAEDSGVGSKSIMVLLIRSSWYDPEVSLFRGYYRMYTGVEISSPVGLRLRHK